VLAKVTSHTVESPLVGVGFDEEHPRVTASNVPSIGTSIPLLATAFPVVVTNILITLIEPSSWTEASASVL
jgi:hypothetical protein